MKKRILIAILSIVMLVGLMPITAFAIPATHSHAICGAAHTDIGDHTGTCENVDWTAWDGTTDFPGGNVYLSADVTLKKTLKISSGTVNLCLNGKVLRISENASIGIEVSEGAELNLCDCQTTEHKFIPDESGLWVLDEENGTKSVYGGVITGGNTTVGSAICSSGTLRLYGGNIVGNHATSRAVVYSSGAEFSMYGGSICGNTGDDGNDGVGLCLWNSTGKHQIRGGKIYENKTVAYDSPEGVGVYVSLGNLTISGAVEIYDNKRGTENDNIYVAWNRSSLNEYSLIIDGELTNTTPIGVWARYEDVVIKADGTNVTDLTDYIDNFTPDNTGRVLQLSVDKKNIKLLSPHKHPVCGAEHTDIGDHTGECGDVTWIPLSTVLTYDSDSDTYNGTLSSGNYYLDKGMTVKGTSSYNNDFCIDIQGTAETPAHVNICLNGHQLKGSSGDVILHVSGGTDSNNASLSICDCYDSSTHTGEEYTHTYTSPISGEEKTVTGGLVTGAVGGYARTMYANCAQVNIYGGTFAGNGSGKTGGGALYMSGAVLRFYDGSITDNYVSSGGMLSMQNAEAHLIGGSVTGNAAYYGVTGNYEDDGVGGVHLFGESTAAIHSGFDISGNFAGLKDGEQIDSNLLLGVKPTDNSDLYITLTGPRDTPIGIRTYEPGVFTSGFGSTNGVNLDDFVSEKKGYFLTTEGQGSAAEVKLEPYAITTQPTTDTPKVTTNKDSDIASYSWHSQASEVVDETSATAQTYYNSTCTDGVWSGTPKGSGYYIDFFKMELKAGDTLTATLVNNDYFDRIVLAGMVTGDTSIDKDGTTYVFEITADDTYTLGVAQAMDANPTFSVVRSSVGDAISGQTTATLTDGTDGETYVCKVTFKDGTVLVSDPVEYEAPVHNHSWTYSGSGNTITATCNGGGICEATNKELTIYAPLHEEVNDGKSALATLSADSIGGIDELPSIQYHEMDRSNYGEYIGDPTTTAPTKGGKFEASITVAGVKASVVYLIEKLDRANIKQFTVSDITNNSFVITLDEADWGKSDFVCQIGSDYIDFTPNENGKATITVREAYAGSGNLWVYVYQKETDTHKKSNTKDATVSLLPATPTPAETPVIGTDLSTTEVTYDKDAAATALSITASVTDGGTLSYQWYKNDAASTDGAQAIDGETGASYTPATSAAGTTYYYCVITNTKDGQTATAISAIAKITVNDPAPTTYTVTYDANGGNGTVVDDTEYESGDAVTLKSGSGLTKSGYTFSGWNTATNGSGAAYSASDTYTITADTIFYAQWTQNEGEKGATVDNTAAGSYAGTTVSGWGDLATKDEAGNAYAPNVVVEVKLTVTAQTENSAPEAEVTAIKNSASGKTLQFLDLTLSKTVDGTPIANFGSTNSQLLTIVIPFQKSNKQNITVYRYHGTQAEVLTENPPADAEGFVVGTNSITIYAKKFSTYAIGYTVSVVTPPSSGESYTPTYTITVEKADNGEVKANRSYASSGSTVTITVDPETGYVLNKLTVTDERGNNIEVTDKGDGTYTFKMPSRKVTVTAAFATDGSYSTCPGDHTCPIWPYTDAETTAWYHDGVHYIIEKGLMTGYGNGIFKPNTDTSRAMIAVMLWRLEGSPVVNYLLDFEDVKAEAWYTEAIRWAKSEGIIGGYGNGCWGPDDAVTREQMVTILWRYAQYKGYDVSVGENTNILSYDDAFDVAEYAIPAMQWACGSGMVQGMNDPDGEGMILAPESKGTRAQIATMMMRFCTEIVK